MNYNRIVKSVFKGKLHVSIFISLIILIFTSCESSNHEPSESVDILLEEITISDIRESYDTDEYTITDLVTAYINRINTIDENGPTLNSVIQINPDALEIARLLDIEMKNGKIRGPLHGIPVLLKDNIDTRDNMETTAGSLALKGSHPLKDSYLVTKLRDAGAIILGKANLSEWANFRGEMSSSGWSGVGGQTLNPYVLDRNPCGSSSGSGVAVSANLTVLAIGTETNGSIVCPSTNNGIVGIKPTVGLISRSGIIPISFTQDTPGPMARTLYDAALCLGIMVGVDSSDSKSIESIGNTYSDYTQFLKNNGLEGKRIGLYTKPYGINYKVDELMNEAVEVIKSLGAEVIEIDKLYDPKVEDYSFEIMLFEYKDGLNNYFKSLGSNASIKSLEELIEFNRNNPVEMEFYNQKYLEMAQEKGSLESEEYKNALEQMLIGVRENGIDKVMNDNNLDAIIAPTGSPAWKTDHINGDSYMLGSSSPAAISGYPNITVPMGFIDELPVGISFFGMAWSELILLEIAYGFESNTNYRKAPKFLLHD